MSRHSQAVTVVPDALLDPDDEPTVVRTAQRKCRCRGWGYLAGVVYPPSVAITCSCHAGLRLRSSAPEGRFPAHEAVALALAKRIGLPEVTP